MAFNVLIFRSIWVSQVFMHVSVLLNSGYNQYNCGFNSSGFTTLR